MSDETRTDKQGQRRAVRRLTQRTIPLPASASVPPPMPLEAADAEIEMGARGDPTAEDAAGVASTLAELRLPQAQADAAAAAAERVVESAAEPGRDTQVDPTPSGLPPLAAEEMADDEPDTNPNLALASAEIGSATPAEPTDAPRAVDAAAARDGGATAEEPRNADSGETNPSGEPPITGHEQASTELAPPQTDLAAGRERLPEPPATDAQEPAPGSPASPASAEGAAVPPPGLDSDVPTRPRIELSHEMALAAGRVTSLELPPLARDESEARRPSKFPPGTEPRVISSLTGRRSSIPARDDDDEASRPAVVVTRARVISDRPPGRDASERPPAVHRSTRPSRPQRSDRPGAPPPSDRPRLADRAAHVATAAPEPAPSSAAAEPASSVPPRASRRPGSVDADDFETLDIEDGEVESPPPLEISAAALGGAEVVTSKAPPPPPQLKRGGLPPNQPAAAPAAKAAPPPPPRAAAPLAAAGAPTAANGPALATTPSSASSSAAAPSGGPAGAPATTSPGGRKSGGTKQARRRQWWETLFSDDYLRTVVRPSTAQISRQVDFMQASLGVSKGTAVLDVGCGLGQHALEFARRGCLVVALDLALPMITRAAEDAQQEGLRINFLHKDIRDIGFEGTFDAVVCVGTTFGFFDDEQNREVLGRLAHALKPGGRLLLEVVNRDHVLLSQPNLHWFEGDGCVVMEETDFNYYSSRLIVKRTMMREDGRQTESEYSIRLYALHELGQMMQQVGFRVKEVSGQQATRGVFFGAQSSRIILLAERRSTGPARGNGHSEPPPSDGS